MGLCLRQDHRLEQRQRLGHYLRQRQELTLEQKHQLRLDQMSGHNEEFAYYLSVMSGLWGHQMLPSGRCDKCEKVLSVAEILMGFTSDVNDFTTACPKCKQRFAPTNLVDRNSGREHAFWCALQTLERLPGLQTMEVSKVREKQPQIYFSAVFHFGSLVAAFSRLKIEYKHPEFDWTSKARYCLGKIPDRDVTQLFGVKLVEVVNMRRELKIPSYRGNRKIFPADVQISLAV